jgi:hypothetical protein
VVNVLSKSSVKLNKSVYDRAAAQAEKAGYSGVQEFIEHVLERELARLEEAATADDVAKKLKGLGYIE